VLRHDVDSSRDPTYPDHELAHDVPATYALLDDRNLSFWKRRLDNHPKFEAALHFRSNREDILTKTFRRGQWVPDAPAFLGRGLARQVRDARERLGLNVTTIHRHAQFMYLPEFIDALAYLYDTVPGIHGGSSLFRGAITYFRDVPELSQVVQVPHPETLVPYWLPFQPWETALDRHRPLPGWELSHLIEPDTALIDGVVANDRRLPGGAYIFSFHPAHARTDTFLKKGSLPWLAYAVDQARREGWWIATCAELFARMTAWGRIRLRPSGSGVLIENPGDVALAGLLLDSGGEQHQLPELPSLSVTEFSGVA
jgi:hypothetical protein